MDGRRGGEKLEGVERGIWYFDILDKIYLIKGEKEINEVFNEKVFHKR